MRFTCIVRSLLLITALFLQAASASAAVSLLHYSSFDTDVGPWLSGAVDLDWSATDAEGDPASGSLHATDLNPIGNNPIQTCVELPAGGGGMVWGARTFSPGAGATGGSFNSTSRFYSSTNCTGMFEVGAQTQDHFRHGGSTWSQTQITTKAPGWARSVRLFLSLGQPSTQEVFVDDTYVYMGLTCLTTDRYMCLDGGRFRVSANWEDAANVRGDGTTVKLAADSGYVWFFGDDNVELVVKVLDGCGINGKHWVFAAGLTNVKVDLQVTDTSTGAKWQYVNPLNHAFAPVQDTGAFAACF